MTSDEYDKLVNILTHFDHSDIISDLKQKNVKSYKDSTLLLINEGLYSRIIELLITLSGECKYNKNTLDKINSICGSRNHFIHLFCDIDAASDIETDIEDGLHRIAFRPYDYTIF